MSYRSSPFQRQTATPAQANIIRIALFSGSLMFGAVAWYVHSQEPHPESHTDLNTLVYVFIALASAALMAMFVLRMRQSREPEWGKRLVLGIVGWAVAEGTALFGGVYFLLTGQPELYLAGMILFVAALVLLSPSREGDRR